MNPPTRVVRLSVWVLPLLCACREGPPPTDGKRVTPPGNSRARRAVPRPRRASPATPRFATPTVAQRAHDRSHRVALDRVVKALGSRFAECQKLALRGAQEPPFRKQWPAARERFVKRLGELRADVLAVDPLRQRSWAVPLASWLLDLLTTGLPDAVWESWRQHPSGALASKRKDFRLIWKRLRHYVEKLSKSPASKPAKDTR